QRIHSVRVLKRYPDVDICKRAVNAVDSHVVVQQTRQSRQHRTQSALALQQEAFGVACICEIESPLRNTDDGHVETPAFMVLRTAHSTGWMDAYRLLLPRQSSRSYAALSHPTPQYSHLTPTRSFRVRLARCFVGTKTFC